ncbi:MAG TPA: pitrilysin family protein [Candidatus Bathyarchaeia archaeon]|nr:pitrilysin family protein [Candidatus Bathyarchaeia archaeon]
MPISRALVACLLCVLALGSSRAEGAAVTETTLDNGLRVLVLEDHRNPIATVQTWYKVGARNEIPGATGLAHFLEHMMFKGTPTFGRGQFSRIIEENGGRDNAFTSHDVTSYYVNIAADRVDRVLGLEADRMRNLLLDAREIDSERQVVAEERRTSTEDDPEGYLSEEFLAAAYKAHPYGWPVIGWMSDIQRINPRELRAFYERHYLPNNALLVVAGDVDTRRVLARVQETFGKVARGPAPPPMDAVEPPQAAERRVQVYKTDARAAVVYIGYHVPNYASKDAPALELLSTILQEGRASRLYRRLVYERRLALAIGGDYSYLSHDPNLFWFSGTPLPGQTPAALEQAIMDEIERVQNEPVPAEELERAKNQIEAAFVWRQDSVYSRAATLARFELAGSWRNSETYVSAIRQVTAADLQRVAQTYFRTQGRTVGTLIPGPPPAAGR